MAEVTWSRRALSQLDDIAGFIALDKPGAAARLVQQIFVETDRLADYPRLGRILPLLDRTTYRMLWVAPCWVYYRVSSDDRVIILHVRRAERPLRLEDFAIE